MKNFSKITLGVLIVASATFTSCNNDDDAPVTPAKPSIYERLGGTKMVADDGPGNEGKMIEAGRLSFRKVVNRTVGLIVADVQSEAAGNLGAHFAPVLAEVGAGNTTKLAVLIDNLTDFFSYNTGGTNAVNKYTGLDMVTTHDPAKNPRMGTKSSNADYSKFEGYVGAAAIDNGVKADSELFTDVVAVLESLRAPIVQK